jgi:hypothetical protein
MAAEHVSYRFAILAMLCSAIVLLFIFPITQGPFPVVNGPLTSLVSIRARLLLLLGMLLVAVGSLCGHHLTRSSIAQVAARRRILPAQSVPFEQITVLRC